MLTLLCEQLLQISHVMPGYFPRDGGWPKIAKTTPGVIRATVYKHLDQYMPSMNEAILAQLRTLDLKFGGMFLRLPWLSYMFSDNG
jgi:hypothetical protein